MKRIVLKSILCEKTQDVLGLQKCRLEILVDGAPLPPLRQNLKDRQLWNLNQSFQFDTSVEVRLWDEEILARNILVGKTSLGATSGDAAQASFTNHGRFTLNYSVAQAGPGQANPASVEDAILQFQNSIQPGVWPNIPKSDLIADIRSTTSSAVNVDQGRTPLCGPAAVIYTLVRQNPRRYVQICQSLYETGQFQTRSHLVKPSATLVNSRVRSDVTLADWMLMSTLRDTENVFFPVEDTASVFVMGFTKPWEMRGWAFDLLNFDNADYQSLIFYGEFEAMKKAQDVINQGGVVFMMIQSAMLGNPRPVISYPDHWIAFLGNLNIDHGVWNRQSGHIQFDCYTWGGTRRVNIDDKSFEDFTWGIVYGSP